MVDGVERQEKAIHLVNDRQEHAVVVTIPIAPTDIDVGK
jgi:hypothetical protein